MNSIHDSEHALYRFFDDQGSLLYVGLTVNLPTRLRDHHRGKAWWQSVARMTVQRYPTRAEVVFAERLAIIAEKPLHNVRHSGSAKMVAAHEEEVLMSSTFVGSFFHSDGIRQWQGYVVEDMGDHFYFVATYSWLSGDEWTRHIVNIVDMVGWRFYRTDEEMRRNTENVQAQWKVDRALVKSQDPDFERKVAEFSAQLLADGL